MRIITNISQIQDTLQRFPRSCLLVVTKGRSASEIQSVLDAGCYQIGENRIQEIEKKQSPLLASADIHLIGHLQTNKVKKAVQYCDIIQSIDSFRLAKKVNDESGKQKKVTSVFLQINISREEQKYGFLPEEILEMYTKIDQLKHLKIKGLMCLPKYSLKAEKSRKYFKKMYGMYTKIIQKFNLDILSFELSMGTSHDYRIALEEGSTLIRVGRGIFEE